MQPLAAGRARPEEPARRPSDPPARAAAGRHDRGIAALVAVAFTVAAVAWDYRTWEAPTHRLVGGGGDAYVVVWALAWVPHAIAHGLNPLTSHLVSTPHGINLMWQTSMPLAGLLLAPVTVLGGPLLSYDVLATLAPALSGWTAYLALRRWTSPVAAVLGALVVGFSPAVAAQDAQHPFLALTVTAPLVLLVLDGLLVRQRGAAWRGGVALGLLAVGQLLLGEEVLVLEAVVAVVTIAALAGVHRRRVRERVGYALHGLAVAAATAALLGAYPLAVQFLGPDRVSRPLHPAGRFVADLANVVTPTQTVLLAPAVAHRWSAGFTGNWTEWDTYVGVPALLLVALAAAAWRRRPVGGLAVLLTVVPLVLALGARVHVRGHSTGFPGPWALLDRLPGAADVLPTRFGVLAFLGVGLCVALAVDRGLRAGTRVAVRAALLAVVAATLATLVPVVPYLTNPVPLPAGLHTAPVCGPARVDMMPFEDYILSWQAVSGFCFAVATEPDFNEQSDPQDVFHLAGLAAAKGLRLPPATRAEGTRLLTEASAAGVRVLLLGPAPPPAAPGAARILARWMTRVLGRPPMRTGGFLLWTVPYRGR